MNEISLTSGTSGPLYKEVKRKILEAIRGGTWKPGEMIPAEKRIAEGFGVSIGTLRKAVDDLAAEQILVRHQGRGTYVATHSGDRYLLSFFHIIRQDGQKQQPEFELLEFGRTKADKDAAARLGVEVGAKLFRLVNRLTIGGEPVIVDEILLPDRLLAGLTEKQVRERQGTLYQLYQDGFGITVVRTEERLRAVTAEAFQSTRLGVRTGDPLLHILRAALTFGERPVELRHSYVDTRRYEYFMEHNAAPK